MMETYDILFRVYIWHSYFTNGKCTSFSIVPDELTRIQMKKYGLIFRQTNVGIVVLVASKKGGDKTFLSNQINTDFQFNFFLKLNDPYLMNITEIETPENQAVRLYKNTQLSKDNESENSYSFITGKQVYFSNDIFDLNKDSEELEGNFEHNGTTFSIDREKINDSSVYSALGLDTGVYRWNNEKAERYFYKSSQVTAVKPFAIISIDFNNENIITDTATLKHPDYHVRLQTKKSYWQYIINSNQNYNRLIIESSNKNEDFEKTEESTAANKTVVVFTSKNEIEITEDRADHFKLKVRNGNPENDLILISKLPLPDISVLNKKTDEKIYTPIYVNF